MKQPYFDALIALRGDLLGAYHDSTKMELDLSKIQKYEGDAVIQAILNDMLRIFTRNKDIVKYDFLVMKDQVLDYRTVFKVLVPDKADSDISPKSRKRINDYCLLVKRQATQGKSKNSWTSIPGTLIIDENFKLAKQNNKGFSAIKFYTSKLNHDLQWAAVFNGFDIKRDLIIDVRKEVLQCFKRESKVCAVITGTSGSGKTIFLRRLAKDCLSDKRFKVLWMYDFSAFNSTLTNLIGDQNKYLIIVDDWSKHSKNSTNITDFLNLFEYSENIRLIIGDSEVHKEYEKYIYGRNVFPLAIEDNTTILKQIASDKVTKWGDTIAMFLKNSKELFRAPLFLILFIVAKTYSNDSNETEVDFNDIISQFKKIVGNDLAALFINQPGIALTLYYWANLYKVYPMPFSWKAFLYLANYYNNGKPIPKPIKDFNPNNSVVKILSQYIYLEKLPHPEFDEEQACYFVHDYVANEGLSLPICEDWYFDNDILVEIFSELVKQQEYLLNNHLAGLISSNKIILDDEIMQLFNTNGKRPLIMLSQAITFNKYIEGFYENILSERDDENIIEEIYYCLWAMEDHGYKMEKCIRFIVEELIKRGCKSAFVNYVWINQLYEEKSFNKYITPIMQKLWEKHYLSAIDSRS